MKKLIASLLALMLVLALTACSEEAKPEPTNTVAQTETPAETGTTAPETEASTEAETTAATEATAEATQAPTEAEVTEDATTPETQVTLPHQDNTIDVGGFYSGYLGCELLEDASGNPILAIGFQFHNILDEATTFDQAYNYTVTQNGQELEVGTYYPEADSEAALHDTCTAEIDACGSDYVFLTYILEDTTSFVTITFTNDAADETDSLTLDPAFQIELVEAFYTP